MPVQYLDVNDHYKDQCLARVKAFLETEEEIEPERLRALPWTRLSIEGAEIRESMTKRYAR